MNFPPKFVRRVPTAGLREGLSLFRQNKPAQGGAVGSFSTFRFSLFWLVSSSTFFFSKSPPGAGKPGDQGWVHREGKNQEISKYPPSHLDQGKVRFTTSSVINLQFVNKGLETCPVFVLDQGDISCHFEFVPCFSDAFLTLQIKKLFKKIKVFEKYRVFFNVSNDNF